MKTTIKAGIVILISFLICSIGSIYFDIPPVVVWFVAITSGLLAGYMI